MNKDGDLTETIQSARGLAEVGAACRRMATTLGFEHFLYGFRAPVTFVRPCQFILSGYPKGWRERYDQQSYLGIDPVLSRALNTVVPFAWDELDRSDPHVARLFQEARDFGLCHGFSVPVHGAHGEGGVLSLARVEPLPAPAERVELFQRAQWFTAIIHQRLKHLVFGEARNGVPPKPLTARERECLRMAAQGMSAASIARHLKIAERTVVYHLNQCEDKLGARRRQEAIARAVALGQIEPGVYPLRLNESEALLEVIH